MSSTCKRNLGGIGRVGIEKISQSNVLFKTPVVISQKTLSDKVLTDWNKFRDISNQKETKEKIDPKNGLFSM